jgi:hypothetical protein
MEDSAGAAIGTRTLASEYGMSIAARKADAFLNLWFVYPLLVPFHLWGKTPAGGTAHVVGGLPQLADIYLTGIMVLTFLALPARFGRPVVYVVYTLVLFVAYTAIVNLGWATALDDTRLLKYSAFYAYDVCLFLTCVILYQNFKERFLYVTTVAVGTSVVLQVVLSPFAPSSLYSRTALFFSSENHLGYFCVLSGTIFVVGAQRFSIRLSYRLIVYAVLAYLVFISQSRGALMGLGALALVASVQFPLRLVFMLLAGAALYLVISTTPGLVSNNEERLVAEGKYDTFATRGYDRIANHPEYIVLGAGEGAYERFRSAIFAFEIHSSFGTILFCYGIPGTLLFGLALFFICKPDPRIGLYMVPAFIYGTSHQGLRFASFWVMLAFLCCAALDALAHKSGVIEQAPGEIVPLAEG